MSCMHWLTCACVNKHLDAQTCMRTDRQTNRWTDSHLRPHARAHTRMLACLQAHTMHTGTYAGTDRHKFTCLYGGKHLSTNMEVRSKKLDVRNKKCCTCIDECTHVRTNIWTHEHAGGQTDRWTDGRKDSNIRPHTRMHTNTPMHALMNAHMYNQTFGCTNMHGDKQTDGWTDSHIHPHACEHTHTGMLACLLTHSGTYARTDRHTYTCSYSGKHPSTNMEVRSKKLEVRNKKCPYPAFVILIALALFHLFRIKCRRGHLNI